MSFFHVSTHDLHHMNMQMFNKKYLKAHTVYNEQLLHPAHGVLLHL